MRPVLFTLLLLSTVALIRSIKGDLNFPAARMLPFCDGRIINPAYTIGGVIMLLMLIFAIIRLNKKDDDKE